MNILSILKASCFYYLYIVYLKNDPKINNYFLRMVKDLYTKEKKINWILLLKTSNTCKRLKLLQLTNKWNKIENNFLFLSPKKKSICNFQRYLWCDHRSQQKNQNLFFFPILSVIYIFIFRLKMFSHFGSWWSILKKDLNYKKVLIRVRKNYIKN